MNAATIHPDKEIKYSSNWNNKLNCRFHTTIRLSNGYYKPGDYVRVIHKGEYSFKGLIHEIKQCFLKDLPAITAALDTGYNLEQTKAIIKKLYPETDFEVQKLSILLIQNIEYNL